MTASPMPSTGSPGCTRPATAPRRTRRRPPAGIAPPPTLAICRRCGRLARLYETGDGVAADDAAALALYREAAAQRRCRRRATRSGSSWRTAARPQPTPPPPRSTIAAPPRTATSTPSSRSPGLYHTGEGVAADDAAAERWTAEARARPAGGGRRRQPQGPPPARQAAARRARGRPGRRPRPRDARCRGAGRPAVGAARARAPLRAGRRRRARRPRRAPRATTRWRPPRATPARATRSRGCMPRAAACRRTARARSSSTSAAAADGRTSAWLALGDLYAAGLAVPQDDAAALSWYEQAASQGDGKALFKLGEAYERSRGVSRRPGAGAELVPAGRRARLRARRRAHRAAAPTLDAAALQAADERAAAWRRAHDLP